MGTLSEYGEAKVLEPRGGKDGLRHPDHLSGSGDDGPDLHHHGGLIVG